MNELRRGVHRLLVRVLCAPWFHAGRDFLLALEGVLCGRRRPLPALAMALGATLLAWVVYVPVHELLHAAGCALGGGRVHELQIASHYGGAFLSRVFPFVSAEGPYAGRLSEFDTGGSDLVYLVTIALPYFLTITGGLACLRAAARGGGIPVFGIGTVLTAAPVLGLGGDYYEMGSVVLSALLDRLEAVRALGTPFDLRSDDFVLLVRRFPEVFPRNGPFWAAAIAGSVFLGWLLATGTYAASRRFAHFLERVFPPGNAP